MRTANFYLILSFLLFVFVNSLFAGESKQIELKDGSRIVGEVTGFSNGSYKIKTKNMGTVTIEDSKISSMRSMTAPKNSSKKSSSGTHLNTGQLESMQGALMGNDEAMSLIMTLKNDPGVKKLLKNPEIMGAVNSGDIQTLMKNPEFMRLMNSSTVKSIQSKAK